MRRLLSILLVLFFSLGPLAATLEASDDARLPACCRRHGAHHCAMNMQMASMMAEPASGSAVLTAPSTCPYFPASTAVTTGPQAMAAASASLPALLALLHSPAASRTSARLSILRTRSTRGPPALLSA